MEATNSPSVVDISTNYQWDSEITTAKDLMDVHEVFTLQS